MERVPLEITLVSAKDLKDVNMFSKMDLYAVVSIHGEKNKQKQKTPVDKDCGPNPSWNYKIKFTVDESAAKQNRLTLKIKIKTDRTLGSDKAVGEVHVPIKELLDQKDREKGEKFVTYSVRTPSGKSKGMLNLSYKFGEKFTVTAPPPHPEAKSGEPVMAYPPPTGYPGGSSSGYPQYPPPGGHQYPPPGGYPPAQHGYPGYPPPPQPGYGGYPGYPPQPGYGGYPGYPPVQKPPKKSGGAGKMALGLGAGLLGGLLVGDMISDASDMAAYDAGYGDGFDDGGGFDF